jgi:precorrin-2 dehydrogenase/sirohydrochlorin ferrochelatase
VIWGDHVETYYPITLKLSGRKAVVVGGGKVAERKITGLLGTGAVITVVTPEVTDCIRQLAADGQIVWRKKVFSIEDIEEAFMIFAATNDKDLNKRIKEAAEAHQLVLVADDPELSNFHVPSQIRRGRLSISVSTGGASPILASRIRKQLEQEFDDRYEAFLEFLFQARQQILQNIDNPELKNILLKAISSKEFLQSENRNEDLLRLYETVNIGDKT